jgi:hypothetical protein
MPKPISLPIAVPEPKEPVTRKIFNIIAAIAGVFGFGLEMTGHYPHIGIALMAVAVTYGIWELFTSPVLTRRFSPRLRIISAVILCAALVWASWPRILEIVKPVASNQQASSEEVAHKSEPQPKVGAGPEVAKPKESKKPPQKQQAPRGTYGVHFGDNASNNVVENLEIYGHVDSVVTADGTAKGNRVGRAKVFPPVESEPSFVIEWRSMVTRDGGNPEAVQRDINWLREKLAPGWEKQSPENRQFAEKKFAEVEKGLVAVASDKEKTIKQLAQVQFTVNR